MSPNERAARRAARCAVGAHMSIAGGLHRALERGAEAGCDVIQIFTRSNQQWAAPPIGRDAVAAWRDARATYGVDPALAHGSYLVNLAASTRALRERSYRATRRELARCAQLGIRYLVIHPGAHTGDGHATGIARIARALDRLYDEAGDCPTRVLLENTAGQGTSIGHRFEHLRDILGAMRRHAGRVGVCIDTCHTLAAGYDIRSEAAWQRTFDEFDRTVGCDRIAAFHVNDSKAPLGARVDRHEHVGRGHVGLTAFRCLVNDHRFAGLPMVLETPKAGTAGDPVNLAILRALAGKRRVGSRARRLAAQPLA
ncbi:MAG: deoxyribonuclease IV [Deltaproteobacteria bacterium]|nr:MAG: deoxyribonuclease IV [Deltaproteobacteria bacterium]